MNVLKVLGENKYCQEKLGNFKLEEVPKFDNSNEKLVNFWGDKVCFGVCYDRNTSAVFGLLLIT